MPQARTANLGACCELSGMDTVAAMQFFAEQGRPVVIEGAKVGGSYFLPVASVAAQM